MTSVMVGDNTVSRLIYKHSPVLTFDMIDKVHQRVSGTAGRNFRRNRKRFIQDEDFFLINQATDEIRRLGINVSPRGSYLLTQMGYLMLVKSFTDELAWKIQREIVKNYFVMTTSPSDVHHHFDNYIHMCQGLGILNNQVLIAANNDTFQNSGVNVLEQLEMTSIVSEKQVQLLIPSEIAKMLKIGLRKVNPLLIKLGLQTSYRDHKERLCYELTDSGLQYAFYTDTGKKHKTGTPVRQIKWYASVLALLKLSESEFTGL